MEIIDDTGAQQLSFKELEKSFGAKLFKRRYNIAPLSIYDTDQKRFIPFKEKISNLDFYFPPSYMVGGA